MDSLAGGLGKLFDTESAVKKTISTKKIMESRQKVHQDSDSSIV